METYATKASAVIVVTILLQLHCPAPSNPTDCWHGWNWRNRNDTGGTKPGESLRPELLKGAFVKPSEDASCQQAGLTDEQATNVQPVCELSIPFRAFPWQPQSRSRSAPAREGSAGIWELHKCMNSGLALPQAGWETLHFNLDWTPCRCGFQARAGSFLVDLEDEPLELVPVGKYALLTDHPGKSKVGVTSCSA